MANQPAFTKNLILQISISTSRFSLKTNTVGWFVPLPFFLFYSRGAEHLKELETKKEKGVLYKHKMADHEHENVKFQMSITKKFKDALTRQANEAIRIYSRPTAESLNSKSEFDHPQHARVVVDRKKTS